MRLEDYRNVFTGRCTGQIVKNTRVTMHLNITRQDSNTMIYKYIFCISSGRNLVNFKEKVVKIGLGVSFKGQINANYELPKP